MDYAYLGNSCQTSSRVLTSNTKFLALNDPIYNVVYTRMAKYPGFSEHILGPVISPDVKRPEEIKTRKDHIKNTEDFEQPVSTWKNGCCGRH